MSSSHGNLADPEYEPTDDELRELARSAFADVAAKNAEALRKVHAGIAELHKAGKRELEALMHKGRAESGE